MNIRTRIAAMVVTVIALLLAVAPAGAAAIYWDGPTGTDWFWQTGTNWVGDAVPPDNSVATFSATGAGTVKLNANVTFAGTSSLRGGLMIEGAGSWTIGEVPGAWTMKFGYYDDFTVGSGTNIINTNVDLFRLIGLTVNAGGTLRLMGTVWSTNTNPQITLWGGGAGNAASTLYLGGDNSTWTGTILARNYVRVVAGTDNALGSATFAVTASQAYLLADGNRTLSNTINSGGYGTYTLNLGDSASSYHGNLEFTGNLTGAGVWAKNDTNTVTLSGDVANTLTYIMNVYGGILNIRKDSALGTATGLAATGTTVSSGATLQIQNNITVGNERLALSGSGAAGQNGALVNVSGTNVFGGAIVLGAASTIASDAGLLTLSSGVTGNTFGLTLTGDGDGAINGIIGTTTGTLTKSGTGTWTLGGANSYTGATAINSGTLVIGAGGSIHASSAIAVNNGGKLALANGVTFNHSFTLNNGGAVGGNGTFAQTGGVQVDAGEFLDPGFSAGVTMFSTGLTLNGTYTWELASLTTVQGDSPNFTFDQAVVSSGTLSGANATLAIDLTTVAGDPNWATFWAQSHSWPIIVGGASTNPFNDGNLSITGGLALEGTWSTAVQGSDVVLSYTVVPEPATVAFLALGGLSMLGATIRRRRRAA